MMDACSFIVRFPSQMDLYPWRAIERLNPRHVPTTVSCESPRDKCFFFFFFLKFMLYVILFYKFWVYLSDVRTIHWSSACPWIDVGLYWQTWTSLGTEQYERDVTQLGGYADTTSRPWNRDGIDDCTIHIVSLLVHSKAYARIKKKKNEKQQPDSITMDN